MCFLNSFTCQFLNFQELCRTKQLYVRDKGLHKDVSVCHDEVCDTSLSAARLFRLPWFPRCYLEMLTRRLYFHFNMRVCVCSVQACVMAPRCGVFASRSDAVTPRVWCMRYTRFYPRLVFAQVFASSFPFHTESIPSLFLPSVISSVLPDTCTTHSTPRRQGGSVFEDDDGVRVGVRATCQAVWFGATSGTFAACDKQDPTVC